MQIVTARSIARRDGCATALDWIRKALARRGTKLSGVVSGDPVVARIDHGRWIADCECKGAEYVDPDEPIFMCLSCQNASNRGLLRPVKFPTPEIRAKIEAGLRPGTYFSWNEEEDPHGV